MIIRVQVQTEETTVLLVFMVGEALILSNCYTKSIYPVEVCVVGENE